MVILLVFIAEIALAITVLMRKTTVRIHETSSFLTVAFFCFFQYEQTFKTTVHNIMQQYPRKPMRLNVDRLQRTVGLIT